MIRMSEAGELRKLEREVSSEEGDTFKYIEDKDAIVDLVRERLVKWEKDRQVSRLAERANDGVQNNIKFAAGLNYTERATYNDVISSMEIPIPENTQEVIPTAEDAEIIKNCLAHAAAKLEALGVTDAAGLLPTIEQIKFFVGSDKSWGGFASSTPPSIRIHLPKDEKVLDMQGVSQQILYHEITHFVTEKSAVRVSRGSSKVKLGAEGFDKYKSNHRLGVYQEPLAEIFSLYCGDYMDKPTMTSPYVIQLPFMVAMLEAYAAAADIQPKVAFQKLLLASVTRDFSIQVDIGDIFGHKFISMLNGIKRDDSLRIDRVAVMDTATEGGFYNRYNELYQSMRSGGIIELPGIAGGFQSVSEGSEVDNVVYY